MSQYAVPSFLQSICSLAQHNKVSAKAARAKQSAKAKRAKEHSSRRARSLKEQRARDKLLDQLVKIAAQKAAKAERLAAKKAAKKTAKAARIAAKTAAKEADTHQLIPANADDTANRSAATQPTAPSKPIAAKTKKLIIKDNRNADRADLIQTLCDNFNHTTTLPPNSHALRTN